MKNSQLVSKILKKLEDNHINLYHDISKEEIEKHIQSIKNLDELSPLEFDKEMLILFSKFKDAHTQYWLQKYEPLDKRLRYIQNKLYIRLEDKYFLVTKIGNISVKTFLQKLSKMICYETKEWLNNSINDVVNRGYFYRMLGLNQDSQIECKYLLNGKEQTTTINFLTEEEKETLKQNNKLNKSYDYELQDDVLYVRYTKCANDIDYPFEKFVQDIESQIETHQITDYILDLRGNAGGDSQVLNTFQELVRRKNLNGVLIIDNGVFSSGRIAVARFKKEFNTPLIGEPTGGAARSYGYNKPLSVGDKNFSASIRFWDFSDVFGSTGAIQPDVYVPLTIQDINNHNDVQLEEAKRVLKELRLNK